MIDSRSLSKPLDLRHRLILEHLDKYQKEFNELGKMNFKFEQGVPLAQGGYAKPTRYAIMNEDHCFLLIALIKGGEKTKIAKLNLVKIFAQSRAKMRAGLVLPAIAMNN